MSAVGAGDATPAQPGAERHPGPDDSAWAGQVREQLAEGERFSVVREYCGHGIGRIYHEDPQVLHYGRPGEGLVLKPGMTFTIEPMINEGSRQTRLLPDGWTVVTRDRKLSAQWEHTVVVTDDGVEILTRLPGDDNDP